MSLPEVGEDFASRRVQALIGSGSSGMVYQVWNEILSRHEALKIIPVDEYKGGNPTAKQVKFYDEIRAVSQVRSPHLATIFNAGTEPEYFWYLMEFIDGDNLKRELEMVPPRVFRDYEILGIILDLALLLDQFGNRHPQIIHGDIKPSNIVISRKDGIFRHAVLVDFGAATRLLEEGDSGGPDCRGVRGSVPYIAPEAASGVGPLPQSDQFSLACVAYELLAGGRAFPNRSFGADRDYSSVQSQLSGRGRNVDRILHRAWSADPADRWPTNTEFAESLAEAIHSNRLPRRNERMPRKILIDLVFPLPLAIYSLLLGCLRRFPANASRDPA